jgi:DNA-binding NarL/FixJ family response regulator
MRPGEFDAVVTDLSMPQMSGFDLAREILAVSPSIPVLVTSGCIRDGEREQALAAGASAMILKPDAVDELGQALDRAIRTALGPR